MEDPQPKRILIVEDDEEDLFIIKRMIRVEGMRFTLDNVTSVSDAIEHIAGNTYDLIILDLNLPDGEGRETFHRVNNASDVPIIVLADTADDEEALDLFEAGAQDYILKDGITTSLFRRAIPYSIERHNLVREVRRLKEHADLVYNLIPSGVFTVGLDRRITSWNKRAVEITGYAKEDVINTPCIFQNAHPCSSACNLLNIEHINPGTSVECEITTKTGETRIIAKNIDVLRDDEGAIIGGIESFEDITERKIAEANLKRYKFLVNTSGDAMALVNKEHIYEAVNNALAEAYDQDKGIIIGTPYWSLFNNDDFTTRHAPMLESALIGERVHTAEWIDFGMRGKRFMSISYYPFSHGDAISHIVAVFRDITANKRIEEKIRHELKEKKESIKKAQSIQRNLNTVTLPQVSSLAIRALYMPCEELGGDFFNIIKTRNNKLLVVIADCTGHGLEAAMDATLLKSVCDRHYTMLAETNATGDFLSRVNKDIIHYFDGTDYPTMFAGIVELDTMTMHYSNAGGHMPYVLNKGEVKGLPNPRGSILGFDEDSPYHKNVYTLQEGDLFFLYSDALVEILKDHTFICSVETLPDYLAACSGNITETVPAIFDALTKKGVRFPLDDDLTIVQFSYAAPVSLTRAFVRDAGYRVYREEIHAALIHRGYEGRDIDETLLVLDELVDNALRHGEVSDDAPVRVHAEIDGMRCYFEIEDEGKGFNPTSSCALSDESSLHAFLEDSDADVTSGLGIMLCRALTDVLAYNETGNRVWCEKIPRTTDTDFVYYD